MTQLKPCKDGYQKCKKSYHASLTEHNLHCRKCDQHLTSLYLCPNCGKRYDISELWTPTYRLKLIKALAVKSVVGLAGKNQQQLMVSIMFLCDMPAGFLEENKEQYEDAIKLAHADITMEL